MLAPAYGIAGLEDRVGDEFNPIVALEYGFLLGWGRAVVLLRYGPQPSSRAKTRLGVRSSEVSCQITSTRPSTYCTCGSAR